MNKGKQLDKTAGQSAKPNRPVKLGDIVNELLEEKISPKQSRYEAVSVTWHELLPGGLSEHCRITDIAGSQLKVAADSPAYLYELKLCSKQILKELQLRCPSAGIKTIRITIGCL